MKVHSILSRTIVTLAVIILVLAVAILGFQFLSSLREEPKQSEVGVPLVKVAWTRAKKADHQEIVLGTGRAQAMKRSAVSAEVFGVVRELSPTLEPGCPVKVEDVLVRLDDIDQTLEVKRAEARCQKSILEIERLGITSRNLAARIVLMRSEEATAMRELQRLRKLARSDAASLSAIEAQESVVASLKRTEIRLAGQLEEAAVRQKQASADKVELEATLQSAKLDLERCVIRSPIDGEIESSDIEVGERVAPGVILFQVVDTRHIEVAVRLPASRFGEIKVGAGVELRSEVEGREWTSSIARVGSIVSRASHTFTVYVVLDNKELLQPLADGLFVEARIQGLVHKDVFTVPRTAFVGDQFFILHPDTEDVGTARIASCSPVIRRSLADLVLVESGLEEGSMLALTNVDRLANGGRVLSGTERGSVH